MTNHTLSLVEIINTPQSKLDTIYKFDYHPNMTEMFGNKYLAQQFPGGFLVFKTDTEAYFFDHKSIKEF